MTEFTIAEVVGVNDSLQYNASKSPRLFSISVRTISDNLDKIYNDVIPASLNNLQIPLIGEHVVIFKGIHFLDSNNIVVEVIVGKDEADTSENWETHYGQIKNLTCKRTSYNTQGGQHLNGGTPFRKNYAGIGYKYDSNKDAFIPPQPYNSWDNCQHLRV